MGCRIPLWCLVWSLLSHQNEGKSGFLILVCLFMELALAGFFFLNYFIYHYGCLLSRILALSSFLFAFCSPGHFAFSDWSWLLDDSLILAGQRNLLMTQIFCKWSPCGFSFAKYVLKECTLPSDFCNSLKVELYLRKRNHGLQAKDLMLIPSALWKRPWRLSDACCGQSGQMEQYR